MAEGPHPFPSRTRPLSPPAPMVLPGRPGGRVGRCRSFSFLSLRPAVRDARFLPLRGGVPAIRSRPRASPSLPRPEPLTPSPPHCVAVLPSRIPRAESQVTRPCRLLPIAYCGLSPLPYPPKPTPNWKPSASLWDGGRRNPVTPRSRRTGPGLNAAPTDSPNPSGLPMPSSSHGQSHDSASHATPACTRGVVVTPAQRRSPCSQRADAAPHERSRAAVHSRRVGRGVDQEPTS